MKTVEEVNIPKQGKKEIKQEQDSDQDMADAQDRRSNKLMYDYIAVLRAFIGDSDAWNDQKISEDWLNNSMKIWSI